MTISYDPPRLKSARGLTQMAPEGIQLKPTDGATQPSMIQAHVSLAGLTSFRVGGPAQWYAAPQSEAELLTSLAWAKSKSLPVTVIGAGSNLLISDEGLPGLAIGTRNLRNIEYDDRMAQVSVGAGVSLAYLARQVARRGWSGLEWAIGIPGTVGGAVVMNAGAHKSCIADILMDIEVISGNGINQTLINTDLEYRYRSSILQGSNYTVTQARFQLKPTNDPQTIIATTNTHLHQRHATQPYHLPSCGSVFRNPEPQKAAQLIEKTGLKGHKIGDAQVSELHANFILNCGHAKASDIYQLICYVQDRVARQWSIQLKPEVKILGTFNP
ncbi:UDP-N-acetylmuramate dehydrogenase [Roseofilum sp. BLCC_M91]|uniref:UDP-N-acetylenolpyruvoylglucosamine reductase n=1 Tax=Roseofilum halophilum BLCC-M91 TaxID=3022259 RepID=A0ABT7BQL9_9CYAN|nr:UDP-N-acetylmuramate dehydrogenase [Roseofilum halophilum]MDJ1181494.1 UDP-N-acetylmuramate dehydrogenase [Roseofilum halophilum BLCC-M91]